MTAGHLFVAKLNTTATPTEHAVVVVDYVRPERYQSINQSINQFIEQKDRSATYMNACRKIVQNIHEYKIQNIMHIYAAQPTK